MSVNYQHARDIDTLDFLRAVREAQSARGSLWATRWDVANVLGGLPLPSVDEVPGVPHKVVLAKFRRLKGRGLLDGCACGCRGDFELTEAACKLLDVEGLVARPPWAFMHVPAAARRYGLEQWQLVLMVAMGLLDAVKVYDGQRSWVYALNAQQLSRLFDPRLWQLPGGGVAITDPASAVRGPAGELPEGFVELGHVDETVRRPAPSNGPVARGRR